MLYYSFSLVWLSNSVSKITENALLKTLLSILLIEIISFFLSLLLIFPFTVFRLYEYPLKIKLLLSPFMYILGEWLQGNLIPIAFPWIRLGNIASGFTIFIQSASVFGALFISLLILYINLILALVIVSHNTKSSIIYSVTLFIIIFSNVSYGVYINNNSSQSFSKGFNAVIVQGNYPKKTKFTTPPDVMLKKYLTLLCSACSDDTDIIIFPETSMHSDIIKTKKYIDMIREICRKYNAVLLFGSQYDQNNKSYNSCITVNSEGIINAAYLKRMLVPVGEYNPINLITGKYNKGEFSCGTECKLISAKTTYLGCSICFESVFPNLVAESVRNGAEAIAVLSNDSWLGKIIPLHQHHSHSIMRAVENRRYVLTSTNTGISSIIDYYGNIIARSKTNMEYVINEKFYLNSELSFYTKYGDIIILLPCFFILYTIFKYLCNKFYRKFQKNT